MKCVVVNEACSWYPGLVISRLMIRTSLRSFVTVESKMAYIGLRSTMLNNVIKFALLTYWAIPIITIYRPLSRLSHKDSDLDKLIVTPRLCMDGLRRLNYSRKTRSCWDLGRMWLSLLIQISH